MVGFPLDHDRKAQSLLAKEYAWELSPALPCPVIQRGISELAGRLRSLKHHEPRPPDQHNKARRRSDSKTTLYPIHDGP